MKYEFGPNERLLGAGAGERELREIPIPSEQESGWRVEAEFIDAVRGKGNVRFTDFESGVKYMEFTEAAARSAESGSSVELS